MKLVELIEKYKGNPIPFDVNGITEDGSSDIAKFLNTEYSAIKDNILNSEVAKFTVSVSNTVPGKPTIEVVLKNVLPEEDNTQVGGETTPTTPDTPSTGGSTEQA